MNLYLSNKKMSSTIDLPYNEPLPFKQKNVFNHRITIQRTFTFQIKKTTSTIELPYNEPLPFKQKNVFNKRITIQWIFTFQTKKQLQTSNYHTMNLYLSNKMRLQPSNYHIMNLYLSNKKMSSTIQLPYIEPLLFKQKTSSTIELPYNEPLPFKRKNVFNHRITIQWTFTFQTKECLQPSNYHTMNLYLSNKKTSLTIELPYNEPLLFKQKNIFNHRITIQWTFTFQTKKCLQPSNYHTMNLYLSHKKMSSTIELP